MLTLSTTTETPSASKTWSSSLARSKASAYWKPEQPPPRTATRSAWSSAPSWPPSSSPIFSTALSVSAIASWGVSVTSQSVARGLPESRALSPETQTAVVCDSTAYLPPELMAERGIETVSLYVAVDDRQEAEVEVSDYADFYARLRASEGGATTSQPSVGDFLAVYEPLVEAGRDVVSVHISGGTSGTVEAAKQARDRLQADGKGGERIHVFDSRTACGGVGLCALAAAGAAAAGDGPEAVLGRAARARGELKMWFAIDTLEYLRR